jgi:hypothetical protein
LSAVEGDCKPLRFSFFDTLLVVMGTVPDFGELGDSPPGVGEL